MRGVDRIVHAGDVGAAGILEALGELAPVTAVRGNVDTAPWAETLPEWDVVVVEEVQFYVLHDVGALDLDPVAAGFRGVIFGHSHQASAEERNGVLYLNPGSAGPRRFRLPVTLARLRVAGTAVECEIVDLLSPRPR